ncbi:hypothetical protein [Geoalkalibacter sp.]|nr:hypothetical protein [Geoalkalibacter sp.]
MVLNQKNDQKAIEAKAIEAKKQSKISEKHQGINLVMGNQKGNQGNQGH